MRTKKNKVYLTAEQREELVKVVKGGTHSAEKQEERRYFCYLTRIMPLSKSKAK